MEERVIEANVTESSGNVFADLGLPDAEKLLALSDLVIRIIRAMRRLGLTQEEASRRMGVSQSEASDLMSGNFKEKSESDLTECLNRLGAETV